MVRLNVMPGRRWLTGCALAVLLLTLGLDETHCTLLLGVEPPAHPLAHVKYASAPTHTDTTTDTIATTAAPLVQPVSEGFAKVSTPVQHADLIETQISDNINRMQTFDQRTSAPHVSDEDIEKVFKDFKVLKSASSDSQLKQQSLASLPVRQMSAKDQARCAAVINNISLYRRMPTISFEVHPMAYQYYVSHPDVAVAVWRNLQVTKMNLWQTGADDYECDDKAGTLAIVDYLYRSPGLQIVYCDGDFASPFISKPIHASGIFALKTEFKPQPDGRFFVVHTADVFISFPSTTIETAAKLISPISNMIADRNFREVSLFVHTMSKAMQTQPGWIEQMCSKLEGVLPQRKEEMLQLTANVYADEQKRLTQLSMSR